MRKATYFIFALLAPLSTLIASELYQGNGLQAKLSTGYFHGYLKELVYYEDNKISQLDWFTNTAIISAETSYTFFSRLTLNLSAWTNIPTLSNNKMDNYDWLTPGQESYSHHSWHPDTHLLYAHMLDANIQGWAVNNHKYGLALLAGYSYQAINLDARGGCFSYDNGQDTGCFPDGLPGIGYTQIHRYPYVGMVGGIMVNKWTFNIGFKYSHWVLASGLDYHYKRYRRFDDKDGNADLYGLSGNIMYSLNRNLDLFVNSKFNYFTEANPITTITNTETGESFVASGGLGGIKQVNYSISIGAAYAF